MSDLDMLQLLRNRHDEIRVLCEKHKVTQLAVFGSAATGKFYASSDLDFLVDFEETLSARDMATAFFGLKEDLEAMFSRPVDLITAAALTNPYFRSAVMEERQLVYAA